MKKFDQFSRHFDLIARKNELYNYYKISLRKNQLQRRLKKYYFADKQRLWNLIIFDNSRSQL